MSRLDGAWSHTWSRDISIEGTVWTQYSTHPDLLDYASITCHLVWSSASCSNQNCLVSITIEMIFKWDLMSRFGIVTYKMIQEPIHNHMSTHRNSLFRPRMPKVDFKKMWQGQFDPPHFHPFPPFPGHMECQPENSSCCCIVRIKLYLMNPQRSAVKRAGLSR